MNSLSWTLSGLIHLCWLATAVPVDQVPLSGSIDITEHQHKPLHGRFLHISDLHPDPYYKYHSSVAEEEACHRGKGPAGHYGAETTSCDSPFSLINATFDWIEENIKDTIDFIIWTGDSARHDNDEANPRDEKEIQDLNRFTVDKFVQVFGEKGELKIPVVPTWGNNDVLPHNIFYPGPNKWTRAFLDIWRRFIPESQRHGFEYGGWFWSEVIPNQLAVLSVNSLYFADNNAAVDGCADKSQPGYTQFEWLRIQLQSLRKRGMKAIIIGHQAPARTESKKSWDETCWQKYTLWLYQYRDIIVGTAWGHMNIDHFMLQDIEDVNIASLDDDESANIRTTMDDEISVQGTTDYLTELRQLWHKLPSAPKKLDIASKKQKDKFYKKIGGPYGQRYSLSLVTASIVPNYYPTLRIIEYNASSLEATVPQDETEHDLPLPIDISKSKNKFKIPRSPSKSAPPGPAYSPQPFTWLKYTQYYSNITIFNNDFHSTRWKEGKHRNEQPESNPLPNPRKLHFEVEYDTRDDDAYKMKDLTVLSYLELAETIGQYKPTKKVETEDDVESSKHGKKSKKHKQKDKRKHKKDRRRRKLVNKVWHAFIRRAFVGAIDDADLEDNFGQPVEE